MTMERGLYSQVVMVRRNDSDNKKERKKPKNIISKGNQQDQCAGLILIMSG